MKKTIIAIILLFASVSYAFPPTPPGSGSMSYPDAGVPVSTGSAWGTSLNITAISNSTSTTSSTTAASATAVKAAYDLANGKGAAITVDEVFIPAGGMIPDTSSGLLQYDATNIIDYLAFDKDTEEYAMFVWYPKGNWDLGTIKAKFLWAEGVDGSAGHDVVWGISCYAVSDGETYDVAFSSGAQTVTDSGAASDKTNKYQRISGATGAITVQGTPAAGDVVYCRVYRDADAVADTLDQDAWLLGVKIQHGLTGSNITAW